jgi:hypothetical protein
LSEARNVRAQLRTSRPGPAFGMSIVYYAAVLVEADRNERRAWAEHKVRLELGVIPLVPAPVVAQVSRSLQQPNRAFPDRVRGHCSWLERGA